MILFSGLAISKQAARTDLGEVRSEVSMDKHVFRLDAGIEYVAKNHIRIKFFAI